MYSLVWVCALGCTMGATGWGRRACLRGRILRFGTKSSWCCLGASLMGICLGIRVVCASCVVGFCLSELVWKKEMSIRLLWSMRRTKRFHLRRKRSTHEVIQSRKVRRALRVLRVLKIMIFVDEDYLSFIASLKAAETAEPPSLEALRRRLASSPAAHADTTNSRRCAAPGGAEDNAAARSAQGGEIGAQG